MLLSPGLKKVSAVRVVVGKSVGILVSVGVLCSLLACSDSDSDSGSDDGKLNSYDLVVADINRDSRLDIVMANTAFTGTPNPGSVKVILQDGITYGEFENGVFYEMGADSINVAVGDVNNDGKPDVLSTSRSEELLYYREQTTDGAGELGEDEQLEVGLRPGAMVVADINGDNFDDIIVSGSSLVFWLFEPADPDDPDDFDKYVFGGREPISGQTLAVAQLNNDTRLDIIAGSSDTGISVLLQDPSIPAGFAPVFFPAEEYEVGVGPSDIEVADVVSSNLVNPDDGLLDIVVVSRDVVSVLKQQAGGNGTFNRPADEYRIEGDGKQLVIADLDGDSYLDMAVTNHRPASGFSGISLLLRDVDGDDDFVEGTYIRAGAPWGLGFGDFDRVDGLDLVYSNIDGAWLLKQNPRVAGEFEPAELVGGDNNSDD